MTSQTASHDDVKLRFMRKEYIYYIYFMISSSRGALFLA